MKRHRCLQVGLLLAAVPAAAAALVLLLLGLYAGAVYAPDAGEINGRLLSGGEQRRYILHVPDTYDPSVPAPLVISLHGFAEWPAHQMQISRWNDLSDREGFLVVYPAGTGFPLRWRILRDQAGTEVTAVDVEFISALIDTLSAEYNLDPARIYANGLSNGGGMSEALACLLSDRIAAVGGVAGAYVVPPEECRPGRAVPVIAFHGTADPIVPFAGGKSGGSPYAFSPVADWAAGWAARNGCFDAPESLPAAGEVSGIRYGGCRGGAEVIFYTVVGGGHTWPGGEPLPEWIAGRTTLDIDATAVMWEFFLRNPLTTD
ncbi:MAG: hypothetical protein JW929_11660 [Anaerolineales bacterium]|nr:hypothetical protein [Anaerolineales bacterium]